MKNLNLILTTDCVDLKYVHKKQILICSEGSFHEEGSSHGERFYFIFCIVQKAW
jgi:hypothetical protein